MGRHGAMSSWRAWLGLAQEVSLNVLAPRRCAGCDEPLPRRTAFCLDCARTIEPTRSSIAPYFYGGALAEAMMRFKYKGRADLAEPLGELLRAALLTTHIPGSRIDVVVPVPLHPARLRERGYNQTALLAAYAARACGSRVAHALVRVRNTEKQALGTRASRLHNVEGAFVAHGALSRLRVLLVDDVCTTGATLKSCSEALLVAGAHDVQCVAVAQSWGSPSQEREKRATMNVS